LGSVHFARNGDEQLNHVVLTYCIRLLHQQPDLEGMQPLRWKLYAALHAALQQQEKFLE
jgi:hypothetical protein